VSDVPFSLKRDLQAIERLEEDRARERQAEARTGQPINLGFARDIAPGLRQAVDRLWEAAHSLSADPIRVDPVLGKLWQDVNRGYSTLDEADFFEFTNLPPLAMRSVARWLNEGRSFEEASWLEERNQQPTQKEESV
jgi:hypothetical protein